MERTLFHSVFHSVDDGTARIGAHDLEWLSKQSANENQCQGCEFRPHSRDEEPKPAVS